MEQRSYNTMAMGRSVDLLTKDQGGGFFGRRTRVEQILIVVCAFLAILSISLIIAVIVMSKKQEAPEGPTTTEVPTTPALLDEECTSEVCKAAAETLKASINNSVDPCEDFYSYVCSGWKQDNQIPDAKSSYSSFAVLSEKITKELKTILTNATFDAGDIRTKAKIFYQSCIDNETRESNGTEGLKSMLQNIGGWPLLGDSLQNYSWTDAIIYSISELSSSYIINMGVVIDAKNTTRRIIGLDQTSLGVGRIAILANDSDERIAEIMSAYKNFIRKSARIMGSKKSDTNLDIGVQEIIEFEKILAVFTKPPEERRDPNSLYNKYTVNSLQPYIEELDLQSFLSKVMQNITEVTGDTEIIVGNKDYLSQVSKLLSSQTVKNETIANYIGWRLVESCGPSTTQEFRDAELEFNKVVYGMKEAELLDDFCIRRANDYFGFAVGSLYINNEFDIATKKTEIENMITHLKIAFSELLETNTWMNDESKKEAENKLNKMIPMVAYPPWINDAVELNDYYAELENIAEHDFFGNMLSITRFFTQKGLKKINEPYNRTEEWGVSPAIVNAFYSPNANTITFPAGILNFPFYQVGLPPAINYGSVGSVIGHEITHGFDDQGSQFDAEGNLKFWWSDEVKAKFLNEALCFVQQYGNYTEPTTGMALNGINTLGENIADNGGIREAYKAYRAVAEKSQRNIRLPGLDLTSDQLFFVSFSYIWCSNERKEYLEQIIQYEQHSPTIFRTQGPCSNFKEFSVAFNCPANSTMNPEHRCSLW